MATMAWRREVVVITVVVVDVVVLVVDVGG